MVPFGPCPKVPAGHGIPGAWLQPGLEIEPAVIRARRAAAPFRELIAVAVDTGELAARNERLFAKNWTVTALKHARALRERRGQPGVEEQVSEQRSLSVYDQLIV